VHFEFAAFHRLAKVGLNADLSLRFQHHFPLEFSESIFYLWHYAVRASEQLVPGDEVSKPSSANESASLGNGH
jgi:hypothetical protein